MPTHTSKDQPIGGSQSIVCPPGFDLVGSQCLPAASATAPTPSAPVVAVNKGTFLAAPITVHTSSADGEPEDVTLTYTLPEFEFPWRLAGLAVALGLIFGRK